MDPHLISYTLSPDDQQAVQGAIETLRQKLPFLINLTTDDRSRLAKAGDKTKTFVGKAMNIANEHPELFPAAFLNEMRKDAQLQDNLAPITLAIETLAKKLDDTMMQLGAESFAAARTVYTLTKTPFAKAALRTASDELAKHYGSRRKKADAAETVQTDPPATPTTTPPATTVQP
jgi:hypothetical protein